VAENASDADPLWYFPASSPAVAITAPRPGQVSNHAAPTYAVAASGSLLTGAWLAVDGAYSNTTLASNFAPTGVFNFTGTFNATAWADLANGTHVVTISVRNWFGRVALAAVVVNVELVPPKITIISPVAGGLYGVAPPAYNLSITTPYPSGNIWYSVNGSSCVNATSPAGTIDPYLWAVQGSGSFNITFWTSDAVGNVGSATVCVTRSTEVPQVSVAAPAGGQLFNATPPVVTASAVDLAPVEWYCEVGSGAVQYLLGAGYALTAPVPAAAWGAQPDGYVALTVIAVDSLGNQNSTVVTVQKDTTPPVVTVAVPPPALFGLAPAQFAYAASDPHLNASSLYYTLDDNLAEYPLSASNCITTIGAGAWAGLAEGIHTLTVWAADDAGNVGSSSATFAVILNPPAITILSKGNGTYGAPAPAVEVSITGAHVSAAWYTIGGEAAMFGVPLNGSFPGTAVVAIDAAAWGDLPTGMYNITFWASNAVGLTSSASWWAARDAAGPSFQGMNLYNGEEVGATAPSFIISASDPCLVQCIGYSIDGGQAITWLLAGQMAGNISQALWDAVFVPGASVTITFYANDSLNNMSTREVTVLCSSSPGVSPWWFLGSTIWGGFILAIAAGVCCELLFVLFRHTRAGHLSRPSQGAGKHTQATSATKVKKASETRGSE
jgi:hypothetical protein